MNAYKVATTLTKDGVLLLEGLPFVSGDAVEIIVIEKSSEQIIKQPTDLDSPLKGSVLRYDDPFGPAVEPEEWDVLK